MPFFNAVLQCRFARSVAKVLPLKFSVHFSLYAGKTLNLRLSVVLYGDRDGLNGWNGLNDLNDWNGWNGWNDWNDPHDLHELVNGLNTWYRLR